MFYAKLKWSACIAASLLFCTILSSVSLFAFSFSADVAAAPNEPVIEVKRGQGKPTDQRKPGEVMLPETKKAIDTGLAFLAKEQGKDGAWKLRADSHVGATSIAGLAFLSAGNSPGKGKYAANVRAAIAYLSKCVDDNHPGYLHNPKTTGDNMYSHGFATLFLAEAYRAASDNKQKQAIKPTLESAVKLITKAQNAKGGWRYTPQPTDGDLTVTACQMRALQAAKRAGINVPKKTLDAGFDFIASCQMKNGSFKYQPFAGVGNYTRTAVALSVLSDGGEKDDVAKAAIAYARDFAGEGVTNLKENDANYWYARFHENRALQSIGDPDGHRYLAMQNAILPLFQEGRWSDRSLGSSYATAMAILALAPPAANKHK